MTRIVAKMIIYNKLQSFQLIGVRLLECPFIGQLFYQTVFVYSRLFSSFQLKLQFFCYQQYCVQCENLIVCSRTVYSIFSIQEDERTSPWGFPSPILQFPESPQERGYIFQGVSTLFRQKSTLKNFVHLPPLKLKTDQIFAMEKLSKTIDIFSDRILKVVP